ncbi:MAG: thiol-disulfide oxidoreductase DCC family protein [Flammeovirgaceae bacterium]|nr:thiol-disulfide oxidoreductase DCC family protein [Flammeovirgaceae bacterium]
MTTENIIFFDGVCNLCNGAVQFIIKRDPKNKFRFASLQSDFAIRRLKDQGIDPQISETIILLQNGKIFTKSRAALEISKRLSGLWPLLYSFAIIPGFLRDSIYNLIARNRYRWFGKRDACMIPTPELKSRFLD